MGSRWKGSIEPGSMPGAAPVLRHAGHDLDPEPALRRAASPTSTAACAGITRDALERMDLHSQSWEYASEMVLKSVHMELRTAEVPGHVPQGPRGAAQPPQARRAGSRRSAAAWINLRAMFVYGSDFFLFKPGIVLMVLGLLLTLPAELRRPRRRARSTLSLQLAVPRRRHPRGRAARRSSWAASPRCCSTTPGAQRATLAAGVPVHPHGPDRLRPRCCSASRSRSRWSSTYVAERPRARSAPTRVAEPPRGDRPRARSSRAPSCSCSRCCCTAPSSPRPAAAPTPPPE